MAEQTLRHYLAIDDYLQSFIPAQALRQALRCGLIDALTEPQTQAQLEADFALQPSGCRLQLALLASIGVCVTSDAGWQLSAPFRELLRYRDLIAAKLEFAAHLAPDLLDGGAAFFGDTQRFMAEAKTFELFDYQRCYQITPANLTATAQWVELTSAYTRYEAPVLSTLCDFGGARQLVDLGGNSGEAALQLCQRWPQLEVTVVDLPVVCEVGRQRLAGEPLAARIGFLPGDLLEQPPPQRFQLALYKSFLHDWPEQAVDLLLERAWQALQPGGELIIFERQQSSEPSTRYGDLPILLFASFYRQAQVYIEKLSARGFVLLEQQQLTLDWPFMLLRAQKPS